MTTDSTYPCSFTPEGPSERHAFDGISAPFTDRSRREAFWSGHGSALKQLPKSPGNHDEARQPWIGEYHKPRLVGFPSECASLVGNSLSPSALRLLQVAKRSQGEGTLAEPRRTVPGKAKVPFDPGWFWRQFRGGARPGPCRRPRAVPDMAGLPGRLCLLPRGFC